MNTTTTSPAVSSITLEEAGARLYIVGNTYSIKDSIKAAGGHWDADRKQWWVGKAKRSVMEAAISKGQEKADEISDRTEVRGKVEYKGRNYYLLASARDGSSYKVCSMDGSLCFWAKAEAGAKIVKHYGQERGFRGYGSQSRQHEIEYPTIGSLRRFAEQMKREKAEPESVERRQCWECGSLVSRSEIRGGEWFAMRAANGAPLCYCGC